MRSQKIRPSQFIFVYGPGAILEGPHGPRIIPGLREGLLRNGMSPEEFEIPDERMSKAVLNGKKMFEMPSKNKMKPKWDGRLYLTSQFPRWRMCVNASGHKDAYLLYLGSDRSPHCPVCGDNQSIPGATRFVMACPDGHVDEVDWYRLAHGNGKCGGATARGIPPALSGNDTFYYRSGGPISSVTLECPRCGATGGLGKAYGGLQCSGRSPENEPPGSNQPRRPKCPKPSKIIHRQASNLRVPVVDTHFTIGPYVTSVHEYMKMPVIRTEFFGPGRSPPSTKSDALERLNWLCGEGYLSADKMAEIRLSSWDVLKSAIDGSRESPDGGFGEMITSEFMGLKDAAKNGAPPEGRPNDERVWFEVERNSTREVPLLGRMLQVTPVKRLRTVTVQTGFRRMIGTGGAAGGQRRTETVDEPPEAKEVDISFDSNGRSWYPGVVFLGEGLFITSADGVVRDVDAGAARAWHGATEKIYNPYLSQHGLFRELDPVFVWWHTLAHALTRTVGEYAGYSSASIRERVYVNGRLGGILLYATQPGNDGTLGGLISLAPHFDRILQAAKEGVDVCSGDPLCRMQEFSHGDLNGAACYGCLMNSETSCEHRNMWLDRHVLLDDIP